MADCPYHFEIGAYHDGELEAARRQEFADHLLGCPSCRQELAQLRHLSELFAQAAQAPQLRLSQIALHRLYAKAEEAVERGVLRMAGWISAVAASVLLVSGMWLSSLGRPEVFSSAQALPPPWAELAVAAYSQSAALDTGSPAAAWYLASARTQADSTP